MSRCSSGRSFVVLFASGLIAHAACDDPPGESLPLEGCLVDRDCQDGRICNGVERCEGGACQGGPAVQCDAGDQCLATGECGQPPPIVPACDAPRAPMIPTLPGGTTLTFDRPVELGTALDPLAPSPSVWQTTRTITLPDASRGGGSGVGSVTVFARAASTSDCTFRATYTLVDQLPSSADDVGGDAIAADDARIAGWAAGWVEPVAWGADNDPGAEDPRRALGLAGRDALDATSLGNGGALTLVLPWTIGDDEGPEFVIFENGFSDLFLELAFVEVSSDGVHFARFDALVFDLEPVSAYGTLDASRVAGLAGRHRVGYGTPFDLGSLAYHPEVRAGRVDLAAVMYVRVVDIIGDGTVVDNAGNPIYDPTPTYGTAGFDLDGVGVLAPAAPVGRDRSD